MNDSAHGPLGLDLGAQALHRNLGLPEINPPDRRIV
jgi:hypothetical protein